MTLALLPLTLGIIGNAMSIFAFCSTIPTFWRIVKRKSVEDFNEHPYIFSLLSGMLWCFYGILILRNGGLMIIIINGIGCFFQYIYLALYIAFSPPKKQRVTWLFLAGVHLTFVAVVLVVKVVLKQASIQLRVMGICSSMAAIAMFGSPFSIMGVVILTKSVEYMPFLLSFSFTLRTGTWCAYSYVIHDIYLEITTTIGVALGVSQLLLYTIYYKKPHKSLIEKNFQLQAPQSGNMVENMDNHALHENPSNPTSTKIDFGS